MRVHIWCMTARWWKWRGAAAHTNFAFGSVFVSSAPKRKSFLMNALCACICVLLHQACLTSFPMEECCCCSHFSNPKMFPGSSLERYYNSMWSTSVSVYRESQDLGLFACFVWAVSVRGRECLVSHPPTPVRLQIANLCACSVLNTSRKKKKRRRRRRRDPNLAKTFYAYSWKGRDDDGDGDDETESSILNYLVESSAFFLCPLCRAQRLESA